MRRKVFTLLVAAAGMVAVASLALASHDEPSQAKKFQSTWVKAYPACAAPGKTRYPFRGKSRVEDIATHAYCRSGIELRTDSTLRMIAHHESNEQRAGIEFLALDRYTNR